MKWKIFNFFKNEPPEAPWPGEPSITFGPTEEEMRQKEIEADELPDLKKIEKNPSYILTIKNPTFDDLSLALDISPELAKNFDYIPKKVQFSMVEKNPENVKYINNPHPNVQRFIILQHKEFVKFLHDISSMNALLLKPGIG